MPFPDFKDVAFGHWHQQLTWTDAGITMRCSPSPESNNYYAAENLAALGLPAQRMMFVNPKGIVTADYENVWLDWVYKKRCPKQLFEISVIIFFLFEILDK